MIFIEVFFFIDLQEDKKLYYQESEGGVSICYVTVLPGTVKVTKDNMIRSAKKAYMSRGFSEYASTIYAFEYADETMKKAMERRLEEENYSKLNRKRRPKIKPHNFEGA